MGLKEAEALVKELVTSPDKYFEIEFDSAQTAKGLTKIPLISKNAFASSPTYTLLQALEKGKGVQIKEKGSVHEIGILNQSEYPILIPCGTLFVSQKGGFQDRVSITDVMVDGGKKIDLPVVCVEEYRWSERSMNLSLRLLGGEKHMWAGSDFSPRYFASPDVSFNLIGSTTKSLRRGARMETRTGRLAAGFAADQDLIWRTVEREIRQAKAETPTKTLAELNVKKEERTKVKFDIYENEIGDIFFGMGRVLAMELYNSPKTWELMAKSTIKRYTLESSKRSKFDKNSVENFLIRLGKCKLMAADSVGLGYDVRLTGENIEGASLVAHEVPIHFTAITGSEHSKDDERYRPGEYGRDEYNRVRDLRRRSPFINYDMMSRIIRDRTEGEI